MSRPCPLIAGFECPIMPGLECFTMPVPEGNDGKLAYCRQEAYRAGFLDLVSGKFERKEGWKPGEEPRWVRRGRG